MNLLAKNRRVLKRVTVETAEGPAVFEIVKPTLGDKLTARESAEAAGLLDAQGNPKDVRSGARLGARMMSVAVYRDGQPVCPMEQADDLLDVAWFEDVSEIAGPLLNPTEEKLKGE